MTPVLLNDKFLLSKCENVTLEEGEKIAAELFLELAHEKTGVGLAANQIGHNKNVVVINVKEPLYFINPRVLEATGELFYTESCLSYPGKAVKTKRYDTIVIEADNFDAPVMFTSLSGRDIDVLETVAIQHELAHLDGKTMWDFEYKQVPVKSTKIGRNTIVKVKKTDGTIVKEMKWKKAEPLVATEAWVLVDE
jgi:peptide deformylase